MPASSQKGGAASYSHTMVDALEQVPADPGSSVDVTIAANTLDRYVPLLKASDDDFRLRIVLHDFGMVFEHAGSEDRRLLVAGEPELFDPRWDAFLAAYTEHLCYHAGIPTPDWVFAKERHLRSFWYAGRRFPRERAATILTTPAAFEAHGIWFPAWEMEVV